MSFAGDVKQELSRQIPKARHCRMAELSALLFFCGTLQIDENGSMVLLFRTEQEIVCDAFSELLAKTFRTLPGEAVRDDVIRKKTCLYQIRLEEQTLVEKILKAAGILDRKGNLADDRSFEEQETLQRTCCRRAFLRGAFLAAGLISDPYRSYHLEFLCDTAEQSGQILQLLEGLGIRASAVRRGRHETVYVKDGSRISDILGIMDAPVSMMEFENARILREVRGNINRKVNCETSNIRKTADAAAEQIEDVRLIEKAEGLSNLSKTLDETARIRLQYPTATLQELGAMLEPPVGKSGINHRMRRLHAIAERLRMEQGGKEP